MLAITLIFTATPHITYAEVSSNEQIKEQNHEIDLENARREQQYWNEYDFVEKHNTEEYEKEEKDLDYEPQLLDYPDEVEYLQYIPYEEEEEQKDNQYCNYEIDEYYINHSGDYSSYGEYESLKNNSNYNYQSQSYETESYNNNNNNVRPKLRIAEAMKSYQGKFIPFPLHLLSIG